MNRQLYFCKSWFAAKRKPTEIWTEEQAKAAHENGLPYTVLVDSIESPFCTITITEKFIGIDFLDAFLREAVTYAFQEYEPRSLFLTMATHREFEGETDKVINGSSYVFKRNGSVHIRRECYGPPRRETANSTVDVSTNYAVKPAFGEYDDLIVIERS